ncbi:RraA family protein [Streptomyces sp. NPDC020845]|uniref:RraA family protein n=1 Tax=Streptomyces sp. NPDC020845 TaxID=3365096 RepID=UPI003799136E
MRNQTFSIWSRVVSLRGMTAATSLLAQFAALYSATVSEPLDARGLPPGQGGLRPMWGTPEMAGLARTVELELLTGAIAEAGPEDVSVVAGGGRADVSSWGGIVSVGASVRGVRGVVTDGACRDVGQARGLGFPVFARAQMPVTARGCGRSRPVSPSGSER